VDRLSDYLDKCVEITWLMSVHDPPMRFILSRRDEQIDENPVIRKIVMKTQ
jgi:hypothetical protein